MKTLRQLLLEIPIGNQLFADPNALDDPDEFSRFLFWKGIPIETNTPEETALLDRIYDYFRNGKTKKTIPSKDLKDLLALKNKYPDILDPNLSDTDMLYRGMTASIDTVLNAFNYGFKMQGTWKATSTSPTYTITSRSKRGFVSLSTDDIVADFFMKNTKWDVIKENRIPVIANILPKNVENKTLFSTDFTKTVSGLSENEVWIVGNELPVSSFTVSLKFLRSINPYSNSGLKLSADELPENLLELIKMLLKDDTD